MGPTSTSERSLEGRGHVRRIRRLKCVALLVLSCCLHAHAQAQSRNFIWKATSRQGGTVYLVGSVHLLTKDYYPLNPAFESAFNTADLLVEEVDLAEMLAPESQMLLLASGMLPAGQSLDKTVSPETYAAVRAKVAELGLPMGPLNQFKPWALALTLEGLEWQKAGFDADLGLDKHFYDKAKVDGKQVKGLETLAFQVSRFDGMPMATQDRLLAETLNEMATTKAAITKLADAWKAGDAAAVADVVLQDLKSDPQMYERLLVDRNRTWLPTIEALFSRQKPAFVVVGAAHLVGADGLLQMLRAKGYTIEQL